MVGSEAHSALFQALLDSSDALASLRDAPHLEIASVAVNGDRVDVIARDGDREWRVVFGTANVAHVDWINVFERPPVFTGVAGGRAVVINGPSSSGKSTVLAELRFRSDVPWIVFDEPMFGSVDVEYLIWRERAEVLHRGFLDGIAALARAGNCVALAAGGHPQSMFDAAFTDVPMIRVGLDCTPDELARREHGRRDVPGGLAESSLAVHDGWVYDLRFDTTGCTADTVAEDVLRAAGCQRRS